MTTPRSTFDNAARARIELESANRFESWLSSAEDLMKGAKAVTARVQPLGGGMMDSLATVFALLLGLAIENLLKGKWVKDGNQFVAPDDTKFTKIKDAGDHELLQLADATGFAADPQERDVLARLSAFVIWAGRYPVARYAPSMMMKTVPERGQVWPRFFSPDDFACAERVENRLWTELFRASHRELSPVAPTP